MGIHSGGCLYPGVGAGAGAGVLRTPGVGGGAGALNCGPWQAGRRGWIAAGGLWMEGRRVWRTERDSEMRSPGAAPIGIHDGMPGIEGGREGGSHICGGFDGEDRSDMKRGDVSSVV